MHEEHKHFEVFNRKFEYALAYYDKYAMLLEGAVRTTTQKQLNDTFLDIVQPWDDTSYLPEDPLSRSFPDQQNPPQPLNPLEPAVPPQSLGDVPQPSSPMLPAPTLFLQSPETSRVSRELNHNPSVSQPRSEPSGSGVLPRVYYPE